MKCTREEECMKSVHVKYRILMAMLVAMQTTVAKAHPSVTDTLNKYFSHLKRGIICLVKREPCSHEDRKTVYKTACGIIAIIATIWTIKMANIQARKTYLKNYILSENDLKILSNLSTSQGVLQKIKNEVLKQAILAEREGLVQYLILDGARIFHKDSNQIMDEGYLAFSDTLSREQWASRYNIVKYLKKAGMYKQPPVTPYI